MKYLFLFLPVFLLHSTSPTQDDLTESITRGEELYMEYCMHCHMPNGAGLEGVNPPLSGSDYLLEKPLKAIKAVKYGQDGAITVNGVEYNSYMPNPGLEDEEIADVMNFILHRLGNESEVIVTEEMVAEITKGS